jgi:hypothetical protein
MPAHATTARAPAPATRHGLALSPAPRGQPCSPGGHAPAYARPTRTGDTRPNHGTVQVLPDMHTQALLKLQAAHGPAQLRALAAFPQGGHLRIAGDLPRVTFALAVQAAMGLLPPEPGP